VAPNSAGCSLCGRAPAGNSPLMRKGVSTAEEERVNSEELKSELVSSLPQAEFSTEGRFSNKAKRDSGEQSSALSEAAEIRSNAATASVGAGKFSTQNGN
jgi:hypothetical protein